MSGADASERPDSQGDQSFDFSAALASLRQAGAHQFDPVRLHYLHTLAQRAGSHPPSVKRLLDGRLVGALAVFKERFEQAQRDTRVAITDALPCYPQAAGDLQRLLAQGDFKAVRRLIAALKSRAHGAPLGDLTRDLAPHSSGTGAAGWSGSAGLRPELQSAQYFRAVWSKLSVGKRVMQELDQAPKNAGPINSHMLVLRSLAAMRDISPDYLSRFTSYVDTLLSLDQRHREKQAPPQKVADRNNGKKASRRVSTR